MRSGLQWKSNIRTARTAGIKIFEPTATATAATTSDIEFSEDFLMEKMLRITYFRNGEKVFIQEERLDEIMEEGLLSDPRILGGNLEERPIDMSIEEFRRAVTNVIDNEHAWLQEYMEESFYSMHPSRMQRPGPVRVSPFSYELLALNRIDNACPEEWDEIEIEYVEYPGHSGEGVQAVAFYPDTGESYIISDEEESSED